MYFMSRRPLGALLSAILLLIFTTPLVTCAYADTAQYDLPVPVGNPDPSSFQFQSTFWQDSSSWVSTDPTLTSRLDYSLHWSVEQQGTANETIHALIRLSGDNLKYAWAGIGFGRSMLEAQFIVCHQMSGNQYPNPATVELHEHATLYKYAPPQDYNGQHAAFPVQGSFNNNTLSCEFTRRTQPQDGYHVNLDPNALSPMIWGFNPRSDLNTDGTWFTYHETEHRGALTADLAKGNIYTRDTYSFGKKLAHGFGMMFVWLVLFPFAAYYARYLRSTARWTLVHMITQITGCLLLIAFVIVIFTDWIQLSRPHAVFGLCLLGFILLQFVLGLCSIIGLSNEALASVRKWVRGTHNTLGFTLLLGSVAQVGLGLDTVYPWTENRGRAAWAIYIGVVTFWLLLFIATELYFKLTVVRKDVKVARYTPVARNGGKADPNSGMPLMSISRGGRAGTAVTLVDANATAVPMGNQRLRPDLQLYTWDTLNQAILNGGQFVVANGRYVYETAQWLTSHPGGQLILHAVNGTDITNDYFHEAGFDAEEFVPKPAAPAQAAGRPQLPRVPTASSTTASSSTHQSSSYGGTILQEMKVAPLMEERDWKLVVKSRRTHVHTRLAIQKLSSLLVGELVPSSNETDPHASIDVVREFDPNEYRRYALVENTALAPNAPIVRFRFCLLYPYDLRANEPDVIYPGQSIEICARINNRIVTRYYCPSGTSGGGLSMLEILVKIYPQGVMGQYLFKQKPGQRQVKIRGPFGKPLVSPERPLSLTASDWLPRRIMFIAGGSGITPFLQLLLLALLPVAEPLRAQLDYNAQMEDELSLQRGDKVAVRHHYYDGWAIGVNLRTEQEGAFPLTVTSPRCGPHTRITLVHAVSTAGELIMGAEWIEGALLAYPQALEVHRFVADGTSPDVPLGITYPHGLDETHLDRIARERFGSHEDAEDRDAEGQPDDELADDDPNNGKVFICGPPGFDAWTIDALTEGDAGLDMRQVLILPSDRVL
ncbi:NADH-cytochrome b5 reductase [Thoreauomyces humboldtii]|nr:NADH-cytochrome b5 reductase [Thoreauomyces humboldtii]